MASSEEGQGAGIPLTHLTPSPTSPKPAISPAPSSAGGVRVSVRHSNSDTPDEVILHTSEACPDPRVYPSTTPHTSPSPSNMCDSKKACCICLVSTVVVIIISVILIAVSMHKLEVYEVGLKYHNIRKELEPEPRSEGLHIGEPGFEFIVFPSIFKTLEWYDFTCVNEDGVDIELDIAFQYKINPTALMKIVLEFKDYEGYLEMVQNLADSVIHETCSNFGTDELQTDRSGFQDFMRELMKTKLEDEISTVITDLQVADLRRPKAYTDAIRDKEAAKEGIKVALNEGPRLETKARTKLLESKVQANISISKAEADTRSILAKATAEAESILFEYQKEADAYFRLRQDLGLSVEGFLSYLSSQVVSGSADPVVNIQPPAQSQYQSIAAP